MKLRRGIEMIIYIINCTIAIQINPEMNASLIQIMEKDNRLADNSKLGVELSK